MVKNWLGLNRESIVVAVLAFAILLAGTREIYIINDYSKKNDDFYKYQALEENYNLLFRDYYPLKFAINNLEIDSNSLELNNALYYCSQSLDNIEKINEYLYPLQYEFNKAKVIDFNELKAEYQSLRIALENTALSTFEIQNISSAILNTYLRLNSDVSSLGQEIKNNQQFNSDFNLLTSIFLTLISIALLLIIVNRQSSKFAMAKISLQKDLETIKAGKYLEENRKDENIQFFHIFNLLFQLSEKQKALNTVFENIYHSEFEKAKAIFPYEKTSYVGKMFYVLIDQFVERDKKNNEDKLKFNLQIKLNEALSDLEREMRENASADSLYSLILQKLIKFLNLNQGGFFLMKKNQELKDVLSLEASYAYNYERLNNKTVELTVGLLGTCALEQNLIVLKDIPDNYIEIGSGLGEKKPTNLVLLPIVYQKRTIGVIELAAFKELKEFEINYLREASLIIALFLMNRFREEQSTKDFFLTNKSDLLEEIDLDDLLSLNKILVNKLNKIIAVAIFDRYGKLYNFSKQILGILPDTFEKGKTQLIDLLDYDSIERIEAIKSYTYEKVYLKDFNNNSVQFFIYNNEQNDQMHKILFIY